MSFGQLKYNGQGIRKMLFQLTIVKLAFYSEAGTDKNHIFSIFLTGWEIVRKDSGQKGNSTGVFISDCTFSGFLKSL